VPFLKDHFGILSATFQWLDLPESETLVFTKYQKYQKTRTRSTRVKVPENQKHQSRNPQIKFEGVKVGFSEIQTHQATRLSQAHLLVSSEFNFEHFHFWSFS
jgi:hypothetical protein